MSLYQFVQFVVYYCIFKPGRKDRIQTVHNEYFRQDLQDRPDKFILWILLSVHTIHGAPAQSDRWPQSPEYKPEATHRDRAGRDKAEDREKEGVAVIVYREGTADLMRRSFCNNGFPVIFVIFVIIYKTKQKSFYP